MSITFQPSFNNTGIMPNPKDLLWEGYFDCQGEKSFLTKFLSERFGLDENELFYGFLDIGYQPYNYWMSRLDGSSLKLKHNYPFEKIYKDGSCIFTLSGIFPEQYGIELNLSNQNAENLLLLLNIEFDYAGSIDPLTLSKKIEGKLNDRLSEFTRPSTDRKIKPTDFSALIKNQDKFYEPAEEKEDGIRVIDFGVSQDQLVNQLLRLQRLCDFCIKKNCNVSWG